MIVSFHKPLLTFVAIVLTFVAYVPYMRGILAGTVKPHVFSWVIWAITTLVVFFAQLQAHGGIGSWGIGVSGALAAGIAFMAFQRRTDITITTLDWVFFVTAIASLPLWLATSDPTWSVILLTVLDVLGFGPTLRKAYAAPHSESLVFFGLFFFRNGLVVLALETFSLATVLFPATVGIACLLVIALIGWRRRAVRSSNEAAA